MSRQLPNINLFGPAYSGKDFGADYLVEKYGYTKLSFAGEVKSVAVDMLNAANLRDRDFSLEEINENKASFRTLLQWIGTEFVREYLGDNDIWVKLLEDKLSDFEDRPVVVTDARFVNEAEMLWDNGFRFVYVNSTEDERFDRFLASTTMPANLVSDAWERLQRHPSEQNFDAIKNVALNGYFMARNQAEEEHFFYAALDAFVQ